MDFDFDGEEIAQLVSALAEAAPDALNLAAGIVDAFQVGLVTGDEIANVVATREKDERRAQAQELSKRSPTAPPAAE